MLGVRHVSYVGELNIFWVLSDRLLEQFLKMVTVLHPLDNRGRAHDDGVNDGLDCADGVPRAVQDPRGQ